MGTVTQYNLANVRDALGGGNPVYMSNYYRGGPYVPANRTVGYTAREPASGSSYALKSYDFQSIPSAVASTIYWGGAFIGNVANPNVTSATFGSITYYRDSFVTETGGGKIDYPVIYHYRIYRTYPASYQQAINTGVPSSGTISLSQLYGAANP
jgi:hypothetical protein